MVERYFCRTITPAYKNLSWRETFRGGGGVSFVAIQVGVVGTIFFFLFLYMAENFFIWQKASRETCSFVELFSGVKEKI